MNKLDARRLTGINVIWKQPGAVVDVALAPDEDVHAVIDCWNSCAQGLLDELGWKSHTTESLILQSGVALAISAPIDALYAAVEAAEWLYAQVAYTLNGDDCPTDITTEVARLQSVIAEEANPALQDLLTKAAQHQTTVLVDDDEISVGLGRYATTWPIDKFPNSIDWPSARNIPVGLVTGTNGKTTTVRLTQRMLRVAGNAVGISSTDWIGVDDRIIDRGDYSGPGGARAVLRENDVDVAVLETARGGLLRRGLGVARADAALITNIAEDHLGDFGSQNLNELLALKWIVTQALDAKSLAILNADDALLVAKSSTLDAPICWFSLNPEHTLIQQNIANKLPAVTVIDGQFSRYCGEQWHRICAVNEAPITIQGSARHNVANALGAIALAHKLGAHDAAISAGLCSMQPNDNPGRCNFFKVNGVDVLLDFAHNPSAMEAIFDIAQHHPAQRRFLCFGQAGDRTDRSIRELANHAWNIGLEHVFISELADHRRGREAYEVFELLKAGLIEAGAQPTQISHHELERESLDAALSQAQSGDLIIMLALGEASLILDYLSTRAASGSE